jgi:hypothetical protein
MLAWNSGGWYKVGHTPCNALPSIPLQLQVIMCLRLLTSWGHLKDITRQEIIFNWMLNMTLSIVQKKKSKGHETSLRPCPSWSSGLLSFLPFRNRVLRLWIFSVYTFTPLWEKSTPLPSRAENCDRGHQLPWWIPLSLDPFSFLPLPPGFHVLFANDLSLRLYLEDFSGLLVVPWRARKSQGQRGTD